MPGNYDALSGLLGLGHKGGGGGHGRGGRRGGGYFGPGYWYPQPVLYAEDLPGALPQKADGHTPSVGAKVYAAAVAMKERAEHGDSSLQEVWNGKDRQILHEPDLPKATEGFMWAFTSGASKKTGAPGNYIMYVRTGR
jgi:hypothetical protein